LRIVSPAKINLSLSVGQLQADGYHCVDSFFHLISLHDILTVESADNFSLSSTVDLSIPDEDNLVVKAAKAMSCIHGKELPAIRIHLEKNIPHGAGLGGGSSNAAATIFALSKLWDIPTDDPKNLEVAAGLGSDVPLFLAPTTASVMTGRGEILKESRKPLTDSSDTPLPILVLKPQNAYSSTGAVYKAFDKDPQPTHDIDTWENNLERAAVEVSPPTGEALNWLREQGEVKLAQVAGSGSACWAHCHCAKDLSFLADKARAQGYWVAEASTVGKGIYLIRDA